MHAFNTDPRLGNSSQIKQTGKSSLDRCLENKLQMETSLRMPLSFISEPGPLAITSPRSITR